MKNLNDYLITAQYWHNPGTIKHKIKLKTGSAKINSVDLIE